MGAKGRGGGLVHAHLKRELIVSGVADSEKNANVLVHFFFSVQLL